MILPSLCAIVMIIMPMFRIHWVHYHYNHRDRKSFKPNISFNRYEDDNFPRVGYDRQDSNESENLQELESYFNRPDFSIGLWHVCRQRVLNNIHEEVIECKRAIICKHIITCLTFLQCIYWANYRLNPLIDRVSNTDITISLVVDDVEA